MADFPLQGSGGDVTTAQLDAISRRTIAGLTLTRDAGDTDHDINVTAGEARDVGNAVTMLLASEITKRIDATFTAGDDGGGLDTGAVAASTGYGVWLIRNPTTKAVDVLISLVMDSQGTPTLPAGFTQRRLIGWVRTNSSSNVMAFEHIGDYFRILEALELDWNDLSITSGVFEIVTTTVPPNCMADLSAQLSNATASGTFGTLTIRTGGAADAAEARQGFNAIQTAGTFDECTGYGMVLTNGSSELQYAGTSTGGSAEVKGLIRGCLMLTRSNP